MLKEVAILRQLKTLSAWVGDLLHTTVAKSLKELANGHRWSVEDLREKAADLAERQWNFSERKLYRQVAPTRAGEEFGAIFEHEYGIQLPLDTFSRILTTIRTCLDNFGDIRDTLRIPQILATANRVWIEPPTFGPGATAFDFETTKVTVKVDLAVRNSDGRFAIYDWKTGKSDARSYSGQMECYLLWPHLALSIELRDTTAYAVNLETPQVEAFTLDPEAKWNRLAVIRRSVENISALMVDPDTGVADIRDFSYARHVKICERCPFQRICREW